MKLLEVRERSKCQMKRNVYKIGAYKVNLITTNNICNLV